jgi:hypothetical protein
MLNYVLYRISGLGWGGLKDMESLSSDDNGIEEYSFGLGESAGHA